MNPIRKSVFGGYMLLIVITFLLVAVGIISYVIGAWQLSRYASRVSSGLGIAVLLLPPVTFWFAFFKLEQEGKEMPTTLWLFGMISTILMIAVFWTPISMVLTGRMAELEPSTSVGDSAVAEYGAQEGAASPEPAPAAEVAPPATTNNAVAADPAATNAAVGATNNAAAGTNGATAPATNAAVEGTTAGAAPAN